MIINTFEDYNTSKLYGNNPSIFYFDSDNQDIYSEDLNNEFHSDDKPIELENQNMHEFWNYDNMSKIQDKPTTFETNNKYNKKYCNNALSKLLENGKIKEDILHEFYSFNDINEKIFKNDLYKSKFLFDVNNMFIDKKLESTFLKKKRFRDDNEDNFFEFMENEKIENNEQESLKKRGRKSKRIKGYKVHDKMTSDNIIKKIKTEFFKYMILFINNIIGTINLIYNNKIYKIDYELINRLNREIDLKYLNMTIKDLLSLNVSPKFKKIDEESNKNYIEKILNEKSLNEAIKFAFNMTFRDFINIFSYKKKVKELLNEYKINDDSNDICNKIEKSLIGVDDLFNKIAKNDKNDKNYFSNFVFYLYNYEKWFFMKRGRNKKSI